MNISPTYSQAALAQATTAPRSDKARTTDPAQRLAHSAQVTISASSAKLLALNNGDEDIDTQRVAALREAIASGQLVIDPNRIADALIANARELIG